jgi:hypothetical protein
MARELKAILKHWQVGQEDWRPFSLNFSDHLSAHSLRALR